MADKPENPLAEPSDEALILNLERAVKYLPTQRYSLQEAVDRLVAAKQALRARLASKDEALARMSGVPEGWRDIEREPPPMSGQLALVYRPLAHKSNDPQVAIKRVIGGNNHCWLATVPEGQTPTNPTDGSCHVTHWMPIPAAPAPEGR